MILFYSEKIEDNDLFLLGQEAIHCSRVLRLDIGETIQATDGMGTLYRATLTELKKNYVKARISSRETQYPLNEIHIAIGPTKSIDRFEWFLEKATECGVTTITPITSFHSERRKLNEERMVRIIQSAAKQSLRMWFPKINPLTTFTQFITETAPEATLQYIAHCQKDGLPLLFTNFRPHKPAMVLIGPEGDFTPEEIALATEHNYQEISLGKNRLRTETAGLIACHTLSLRNETPLLEKK